MTATLEIANPLQKMGSDFGIKECRFGTTEHHGSQFWVSDRGKTRWGCHKHVTVENILRGMKGEQRLRKVNEAS